MKYVIPLDQVSEKDLSSVGGKGVALAVMARHGLRVPDTLCIHSDAYVQYINLTGLRNRIALELGRKDFREMRWEEIWDTSLRIRNMFLNTPVPEIMQEAIIQPLVAQFHDRPVVVRSSAPEEDSAKFSFAGLHESYVNISGSVSMLEHIKLVWASLWSDAALLYRRELHLDVEASSMAVLVLEMVNGEKSGVAFSMSPENNTQTIIESVYGLNQGMVDGTVEPDRWMLDRVSGDVISHTEPEREKAIIAAPEGTSLQSLPEQITASPPLDKTEIQEVFRLVKKAESIFGSPQDVEWTWKHGDLYVLQSRAITTGMAEEEGERPWYLSLSRSYENLSILGLHIENDLIPAMISEAADMASHDLSHLPDEKLVHEISSRLETYKKWLKIYRDEFIPYAHGIRLFGMFYNDTVKPSDPYEFMALLQSVEIEAVSRNNKLDEMAEMVRNNPALEADLRREKLKDGEFSRALKGFIQKYGDVAWGSNREALDSTSVIHIVLEMASGSSPEKQKHTEKLPELERDFLDRFDNGKKAFAEDLLRLARSSYRMRDNDNIYLGKIRGQLARGIEQFRAHCKNDKNSWMKNKTVQAAVASLEEEHSANRTDKTQDTSPDLHLKARQIVGQPSGPGIASGTARVLRDSSDIFSFKKGEVLVCDAIDPTMTIVVPMAAGIVERRGGMLIHGAIIAREYGIPCVTGIPEAVEQIHTGDPVTVDGYLGIVIIG